MGWMRREGKRTKTNRKSPGALRVLALLLTTLGVCVLAYPFARDGILRFRQLRAMEAWRSGLQAGEAVEAGARSGEESWPEAEALTGEEGASSEDGMLSVTGMPSQAGMTTGEEMLLEEGMPPGAAGLPRQPEVSEIVGILEIESIGLEQPILRGATKEHLAFSIAAVEPGGVPGETGNFVVAGHNSRAYGRNFNRLYEVGPGDRITVVLADKTLCYRVDEVRIISAGDVEILAGDGKTAGITLLTCHYGADGTTDRLAVCGELVP